MNLLHKELLDTYVVLEEDINNYMDYICSLIGKFQANEAFNVGSNHQSVQSSLLKMQAIMDKYSKIEKD